MITKILCCIIPIFLAVIILNRCLNRKGFSIKYGLITVLIGLGSLIPIVAIQFAVQLFQNSIKTTLLSVLITAIVFNGLIEESVKMLFLLILPTKKKELPVFFSGALLAGFSLGCFETIIYLFAGESNILIRLLSAVLLHTACAGLSGLYVWSFKKKKLNISPFISATLIHGLYNFFAGFSGGFWWISIVCLLFAIVQNKLLFDKLNESDADIVNPNIS